VKATNGAHGGRAVHGIGVHRRSSLLICGKILAGFLAEGSAATDVCVWEIRDTTLTRSAPRPAPRNKSGGMLGPLFAAQARHAAEVYGKAIPRQHPARRSPCRGAARPSDDTSRALECAATQEADAANATRRPDLVTAAITLSIYISRQFLAMVLAMLLALSCLISLFDFIELLRRSASKPDATFGLVSEIAGLRLPFVAMQILPFAVLLGGMLCFWRLTRSSELIVARASGISAWEFLAAPTFCAMLIGGLATAAVSPISSAMLARAEALEDAYLRTGGGPLALNGGQLWLRQSDHTMISKGVAIIHALGVQLQNKTLTAHDVSVFHLDDNDHLLARVEATQATLGKGVWTLGAAKMIRPGKLPDPPTTLVLPTDLTVARVQESFAPPDTLSVWSLPGFIALLERSGFSSIRHRLHFQSLLALPLLAGTMTLVSAGFSMRPARRGGVARMIGGGVAAGFALFVTSKMAEEFGQSGVLPVALAAWAPTAAGLMLAVALLLHMEDG
jgi:lipopolysaccharide export system permease protein